MGLDLHVCRLPGQSACGLKVEEGHSLVLACGVGRRDAKIHRSNINSVAGLQTVPFGAEKSL